ncbi:MAG TPA: sensor histidine kinase [bacterium]|nr:sensor histidine kinase [bacterium]
MIEDRGTAGQRQYRSTGDRPDHYSLDADVQAKHLATFKFSKEIIWRLGEELNAGPDQSILELVKNAYDADASTCTVQLTDTARPGGDVVIMDDGQGMDGGEIQDGWLVLGRSRKDANERTKRGRIPAGSKGLGRLAAMRMGRRASLLSFPASQPGVAYRLDIDWARFDSVELADEVTLTVERTLTGTTQNKGTVIRLAGLRQALSEKEVEALARSLILLSSPFGPEKSGFRPILDAPEYGEMERLVERGYFSQADLRLVAKVNKLGRVSAKVVDWRGHLVYRGRHSEIAGSDGQIAYHCPPATFELWMFLLKRASFGVHRSAPAAVKEWLRRFGGVHLYHNGLRVNPYGNSGNDWLDMNLSRVRSPEERPSTNNSIGRVMVEETGNLLVQKTDRSGFIESDAFSELSRFATDSLEWMARLRLRDAEKRRQRTRAEARFTSAKAKEVLEAALSSVPSGTRATIQRSLASYERARDSETATLRKEVQLYRTLSTAGITAATFAHESTGNPLKVLENSINTIANRAQSVVRDYASVLAPAVERAKAATKALKVLGSVTLSLIDSEKRRPQDVPVDTVVRAVAQAYAPFMEERDLTLDLTLACGDVTVESSEAAVESIVANLLNNSIYWLENLPRGKAQIRVETKLMEAGVELSIQDNGPGLRRVSPEDVWLPGVTTKKNGTGLGLTIVRDAVVDLGGSVEARSRGRMGGAEFTVFLPVSAKEVRR